MKESIPNYRKKGLNSVIKNLKPTDKKLLDGFLKYCAITSGDNRLKKYKILMLEIIDVLEKPLDKIKLQDVQDFLIVIKNSDREQATKNDILLTLKRFLKWHYKDLSLIEDIKLKPAFNNKKINSSTLITPEEAEKLIRAAETLKWKALITLFMETGCRPQEVVSLKWKHIKFNDEYGADVSFYSNKTNSSRTIPIKECVLHLKRWKNEYSFELRRDDDWVFPNPQKREIHLSPAFMPELFLRLCKKAGIRHIHPYMARHTRLTELSKKCPDAICKKYAGHSPNSKMTGVYTHLANEDVKDSVLTNIYHIDEPNPIINDKLKKEVETLRKNQQKINNDMTTMRFLLSQQREIIQQLKNGKPNKAAARAE